MKRNIRKSEKRQGYFITEKIARGDVGGLEKGF